MQVFKNYFRILRAQLVSVSIYGVIFLMVTIIISSNIKVENEEYSNQKTKTMIINEDAETELIQGFLKYMDSYITPVEPIENEEKLKDALFYGDVRYILTIPAGFSDDFLSNGQVRMIKRTVPDYVGAVTIDNAIDNYFNIAKLYLKYVDAINYDEMNTYIEEVLGKETPVHMAVKVEDEVTFSKGFNLNYYNYMTYIIIAIFITGVSVVMLSFHGLDIRRRHAASPLSNHSLNVQLLLANFAFVMVYLILFITVGYILNRNRMINGNTLLTWLNVFIFSITALAISYLIGIIVKSQRTVSAIATALSLGMAFLSGVFVPQEFLGSSVLRMASFLPSFWYVKANEAIFDLTLFNWKSVSPIFGYMGIQLGFAAAIISIALVVSKRKRQQSY